MSSNMNKISAGKMLIDLTPLLDVVLILLVVVLYYNPARENDESNGQQVSVTQDTFEANEETDGAEAIDYESKYNAAVTQNKNYENIDQYVNIITVYAAYDQAYRWNRTVYVLINNLNDNEPKEFSIILGYDQNNPDDTRTPEEKEEAVWDEVKNYIEENISNPELPTVISINNLNFEENGKMLYRDEKRLMQLYSDLNFDIKCPGYNTEIEHE